MLALSAIFAVVLSAVTITQDRALGQETGDVLVTLTVDAETVEEGADGATVDVIFTVSVPSGSEPAAELNIPLTVLDDTATEGEDFTLPNEEDPQVTIAANASFATYVITIVDTLEDPTDNTTHEVDEPQESFTVSLGTLPDGYDAVEPSSITININDGDNTPAEGDVVIDVLSGPDTDENRVQLDVDANGTKIPGFVPQVGHVLAANPWAIVDVDQPLTADPDDDATARDLLGFGFQWIRTDDGSTTIDDVDEVIFGATEQEYQLKDDDVGDTFTVQVWSVDRYGNGNGHVSAAVFDTSTDPDTELIPADLFGQAHDQPSATPAVAYDLAEPFIIVGADRIEPGVVLTRDTSGMFNTAGNLIDYETGMPVMVDPEGDNTYRTVTNEHLRWYWTRGDVGTDRREVIEGCAANGLQSNDPAENTSVCDGATYTLTEDDVAKDISLVATYTEQNAVAADPDADPPVEAADAVIVSIESDPVYVFSPNPATGMPRIMGIAQVGSQLTADIGTIADADGLPDDEEDITYEWFHGDDDDFSEPLLVDPSTSYVLAPSDVGETIKVRASFEDGLGDLEMRVSGLTTEVTGSPGEISRIEPGIRGVTVSADDTVTLSVDIYGLQNAKDNTIGATFEWTLTSGESTEDLDGSGREIDFTAPSSPGRYTVTASLGDGECQPETEADRADDCEASITVQVRRPSAPVADPVPPVNPPGEIPGLIPDADGNQYEVFTPVEGGTFDGGEGYSINVPSGAVPNGEYIGIRMSDDGAASNVGMTHQRYTLGGNMYGVHAVDASGAAISSYVLEDPAEVCVPLPASLRTNISHLSLAAINSDGSLTILAAQVRLDEAGGTMVCGNLSSLPASVAVGSAGAPAAIPTATPVPEPELPPTGGTSPASGSLVLWTLLLGITVLTLGSALAISRRRESVRSR